MSFDEFDCNPFGGFDYDEDGNVDLAEQDLDDDDIRNFCDYDDEDNENNDDDEG